MKEARRNAAARLRLIYGRSRPSIADPFALHEKSSIEGTAKLLSATSPDVLRLLGRGCPSWTEVNKRGDAEGRAQLQGQGV